MQTELLSKWQKQLGYTADKMAELCDVSLHTYNKWASGEVKIRRVYLAYIMYNLYERSSEQLITPTIEELKAYRKEQKHTQEEVAKLVDYSERQIRNWEFKNSGYTMPSVVWFVYQHGGVEKVMKEATLIRNRNYIKEMEAEGDAEEEAKRLAKKEERRKLRTMNEYDKEAYLEEKWVKEHLEWVNNVYELFGFPKVDKPLRPYGELEIMKVPHIFGIRKDVRYHIIELPEDDLNYEQAIIKREMHLSAQDPTTGLAGHSDLVAYRAYENAHPSFNQDYRIKYYEERGLPIPPRTEKSVIRTFLKGRTRVQYWRFLMVPNWMMDATEQNSFTYLWKELNSKYNEVDVKTYPYLSNIKDRFDEVIDSMYGPEFMKMKEEESFPFLPEDLESWFGIPEGVLK